MRFIFTTLFILTFSLAFSQLADNFTDGNFTTAPQWTGDDSVFVVVQFQQTISCAPIKLLPIAASIYLHQML